MSDERDRVDWLAAVITGYKHYPETFGDAWPRELAESLACHLWPWSERQRAVCICSQMREMDGGGPQVFWSCAVHGLVNARAAVPSVSSAPTKNSQEEK